MLLVIVPDCLDAVENQLLSMALSKPAKRICSLLPSATEIVGRLGLADRLVCVTHECDVVDSSNNHESKDILDGWIESGRVARVTSSAINPEVYTQVWWKVRAQMCGCQTSPWREA